MSRDMHLDHAAKPPSRRWFVVIGILGAMMSLPFLAPFKLPPIPSFYAEMLAAALGLLAISCVLAFLRRSPIPLPRLAWVPGLFCLIILGQILANHVPSVQPPLVGALYLLWAGALMVTGAALRSVVGLTRMATALAWFIMAGALLSALAGMAQILHSDALALWVSPAEGSIWGNLGQRNHFADYIALGLCSALFLWVNGKLRMPTFILCAGLLSAILPMSASRSVWLYAGCFLILALVWYLRDRSSVNRRLLWATALLLPAMVLASTARFALDVGELSQPTSLQRIQMAGTEERPQIWRAAWLMIEQSPAFGVGFGQFGWNMFELNPRLEPPITGFTNNAHNLVLHVGAELGIAGVAVLAFALWCWLRVVTKLSTTPAAWWVLSVTSVLGVHALLEYPFWYTYFLGVIALVLGLTEGSTLEFTPSRWMRGTLVVAVALGWLVSFQLFREYGFLEDYLLSRGRRIDATDPLSKAVNNDALRRLLTIQRQSLLAPLVELGLARSIQVSPEQLKAKLTVNTLAMRNFPIDDVVYRQAILLAMDGQAVPAMRQWDLALKAYPEMASVALPVLREQAHQHGGQMVELLKHAEEFSGRR